ncbi:hypothetical protein GCM10011352_10570 [Marinobacterium zhoushanense]|uniref:Uncharacterized protein n=1 Tax=Marinobacterium zhoushanense TaxID=1679163 RepID=A0ABQ1K756_9GAMM|nr:hypothetical protein [Marinobacterium zhoushanense]GGB86564.1 hypothetical protein GCM10011352_10570 [Marinobacterium zhoushanense]
MQLPLAQATAEPLSGDYRLVVCSIGQATPASAKSIALGLGVPVQRVLDALYRAPAILVDNIPFDTAQQMQDLLDTLGYDTRVEHCQQPSAVQAECFDIAAYITDEQHYDRIVAELARFLGTDESEASRLLTTPPGIVIGNVTQATLDALTGRLGEGVELIASNPATALYDLFLAVDSADQARRTCQELRRRGYSLIADQGCVLIDMSKPEADRLWSSFQRANTLRVINQDFLRFDLVLTEPGSGLSDAAHRVLSELAGIPDHIIPRLFEATPVTLVEALPKGQLERFMLAFSEAGLSVRADLISFMHLGLKITRTAQPSLLNQTLRSLGLLDTKRNHLPELPFQLPCVLPELQARVIRYALRTAGTEAELVEVSA